MVEYERTKGMSVPPEVVFDTACAVDRMDRWLPGAMDVQDDPPGDRVHVAGETHGHRIDEDALLRAEKDQLRIEWGSYGTDAYSGWLQVADSGQGGSSVTLHLSFADDAEEARDPGEEVYADLDQALERLWRETQRRVSDAT